MKEGRISNWSEFTGIFSTEAQAIGQRKGEGMAILTGVTTSPTLISQMNALTDAMARREVVCSRAVRKSG